MKIERTIESGILVTKGNIEALQNNIADFDRLKEGELYILDSKEIVCLIKKSKAVEHLVVLETVYTQKFGFFSELQNLSADLHIFIPLFEPGKAYQSGYEVGGNQNIYFEVDCYSMKRLEHSSPSYYEDVFVLKFFNKNKEYCTFTMDFSRFVYLCTHAKEAALIE